MDGAAAAKRMKRRSIIQNLSAALGSPPPEGSDSSEDDASCSKNPSPVKSSVSSPGIVQRGPKDDVVPENIAKESGKDSPDGTIIHSVKRKRPAVVRSHRVGFRKPKRSASWPYFVTLIWAIVVVRLYLTPAILSLFVLPIIYFIIKVAVKKSGLWDLICHLVLYWYGILKAWFISRQAALAPPPVKGLMKLMIKGDHMVRAFDVCLFIDWSYFA